MLAGNIRHFTLFQNPRRSILEALFQYISKKMQRYTFYLYLKTALHVPVGISTYHQEHTQLYLQHLVLVKPLLLPVAIVEELELV